MLKKLLSVFLAIVIVAGTALIAPLTVSATETSEEKVQTNVDDVSVTATNSLGEMLAAEYEEDAAGQEDYTGNNIYEIEIEDNSVYVEVQALVEAQLVVALYDQNGEVMYGSGMASVTAEDRVVQIDLDFEIPEYFIVKAYLLDAESNVPLCKQYECDTYTQVMQEFLAKTTDDFDEEKVLNLDDSNSNNFLVYNDDTKIIETKEGINEVISADEENKVYVIEKIDESISSLQKGDVFSYSYGDEDVLIIKISSITIDGTTATICGEEIALEDAFDFVKIDASQGADETIVDNSDLDEGVEFVGANEDAELVPVGATLIDKEETLGSKLEYELDEKIGSSKITGKFSGKFEAEIKCFYDAKLFKKDEVEFSFAIKYKASIGVELEIKTDDELKVKLGALGFSPVPGVYIDFTPSIVFEGKISAELNGVLSGQIGKKFKNGEFSDNSKKTTFYPEFKVSAEVFIGLSMEPKIGVVGDIITASAEAKAGVKLKAEIEYFGESEEEQPDEIHMCSSCVDGELSWCLELSFALELLDDENLTWEAVAYKSTKKICDFYYSFDTGKFEWGKTCPNNEYRRTLRFYDSSFKPVEGVEVNGETSDSNGELTIYLTKGEHYLKATKDSYIKSIKLLVLSEGKSVHLFTTQGASNTSGTVVDSEQPVVVKSGKCGDNVSYDLYEDGRLIISGTGDTYNFASFGPAPWYYSYWSTIKTVIISDGVTSIGDYMFWGCRKLTSVSIPDSVISIGHKAFSSCNLTSVSIPRSVLSIGSDVFSDCVSLVNIDVDSKNANYRSVAGVLFNKEQAELVCYPSGKTDTSYAVPDSVISIDSCAFSNCTSLKSITIPESVKSIGYCAFVGCTNLTSIEIPNGVTSIDDNMFSGCTNLTSVTIPYGITEIGAWAFSYCTQLKNVTIPSTVTRIYMEAFSNTGLTSVTIPDGVTDIGNGAFSNCTSLTSAIIPGSLTYISASAFSDCTSLTSVTIGEGVEGIDNVAFSNCTSLTNITIPNSVTSIVNYAFSDCTSLASIIISDSVTKIDFCAFYGCDNLTNVYYTGTEEQWNEISIGENNEELLNATIHYNSSGTELVTVGESYKELTAVSSNSTTDESAVANTYSRENLVPDTEAVLMVIQGTEEDYEITPSTLLYISQATVDKNGKAEFTTYGDFSDTYYVVLVFGECSHSSYKWTIVNEAIYPDNGLEICVCDYCGEVIDSKEIETVDPSSSVDKTEPTNNTEPTDTSDITEPISQYNLGDANEDGKVNIKDATAIQKHIANLIVLTEKGVSLADATQDGKVNIKDATAIQKHIAGIETGFPIGKPIVE